MGYEEGMKGLQETLYPQSAVAQRAPAIIERATGGLLERPGTGRSEDARDRGKSPEKETDEKTCSR